MHTPPGFDVSRQGVRAIDFNLNGRPDPGAILMSVSPEIVEKHSVACVTGTAVICEPIGRPISGQDGCQGRHREPRQRRDNDQL